jgi:putative transposase
MKRLQAFKFELRPTGEQQRLMSRFAGSCRFVFNQALAAQKMRYERGEKKLGYAGLCKELTTWRQCAQTHWLTDAPIHPLQQALKDLERAYTNFFARRAEFPRFRKKGQSERFRYPDAKQFKLDERHNRVFLPKLGWMRYRNSREILGVAKHITVTQRAGKWFASIQTEREVETPVPLATRVVGIDVGIARFATLSDTSFIAPLNSFKKHEQRLKRYQRRMSRKVKFSQNWHKAKRRVQKIHARIAHVRNDFLHKATTTISKNHAMVFIEDLQVRSMSRSARGNREKPGRNVAAKSGLNKAILDQGWYEFRRQLDYKLNWQGGQLIAVAAHYTSQTCPACAYVCAQNRKTQSQFQCVHCGYENHADVVGAINILERGHRLLACGEEGSALRRKTKRQPASMKQEPTEETHAIAA